MSFTFASCHFLSEVRELHGQRRRPVGRSNASRAGASLCWVGRGGERCRQLSRSLFRRPEAALSVFGLFLQ